MKSVPFAGCWWITDHLLAGPFFGGSELEVREKLEALEGIGIDSVISLAGFDEFYSDEGRAEEVEEHVAERFNWQAYAIPDRTAPSKGQAQVILTWIDGALGSGNKVFLHCLAGRGRTGTIIGCWLARHGIASGHAVIERLNEMRRAAGLATSSPETDEQRELIVNWRKGD